MTTVDSSEGTAESASPSTGVESVDHSELPVVVTADIIKHAAAVKRAPASASRGRGGGAGNGSPHVNEKEPLSRLHAVAANVPISHALAAMLPLFEVRNATLRAVVRCVSGGGCLQKE